MAAYRMGCSSMLSPVSSRLNSITTRWPERSRANTSMRRRASSQVGELVGHRQEALADGGDGVSQQALWVVALVDPEIGKGGHRVAGHARGR